MQGLRGGWSSQMSLNEVMRRVTPTPTHQPSRAPSVIIRVKLRVVQLWLRVSTYDRCATGWSWFQEASWRLFAR